MNVEPPETLAIIESIVYKSNGFAILAAMVERLSDERQQQILDFARSVSQK